MNEIQRLADQTADIDRRLRQLEAGQRAAASSTVMSALNDFAPSAQGVWETIRTITLSFSQAMVIGTCRIGQFGSAEVGCGTAGVLVRLLLDGDDANPLSTFSTFPIWGELGIPGWSYGFGTLAAPAVGDLGEHVVTLEVRFEPSANPALPWALLRTSMAIVPATVFV